MGGSTIIFLMGPTAVGKTDLAISLANEFSLGLISVDASQVYRGLNIGTAKPAPAVLKNIPMHSSTYGIPKTCFQPVHFVKNRFEKCTES